MQDFYHLSTGTFSTITFAISINKDVARILLVMLLVMKTWLEYKDFKIIHKFSKFFKICELLLN